MNHSKVQQFLGLAQRAGKLVTGEELVVKAVRAKQVHLVILAGDASENTRKKLTDKSRSYDIPIRLFADRYRLGQYIGKEQRVVIGVKDPGFARELLKYLEQDEGGNV